MRLLLVASLVVADSADGATAGCDAEAVEALVREVIDAADEGDAQALQALVGKEAADRILPVVSYRLVRLTPHEGQWRALLRVVRPADSGFDYHELEMELADGRARVAGFRTAVSGGQGHPATAVEDLRTASLAYGILYAGYTMPAGADDAFFATHEPRAVLASIERLAAAIGGDGLLDALRARVHSHLGERDEAIRTLEGALERAPGYFDAYWELLELYAAAGEHAKAIALLELAESRFEFLQGIVHRMAGDHPGLLASPEFEAWMARRGNPP